MLAYVPSTPKATKAWKAAGKKAHALAQALSAADTHRADNPEATELDLAMVANAVLRKSGALGDYQGVLTLGCMGELLVYHDRAALESQAAFVRQVRGWSVGPAAWLAGYQQKLLHIGFGVVTLPSMLLCLTFCLPLI